MINISLSDFAVADYNCGSYGSGNFGETQCETSRQTTNSTTNGSQSGYLADTGYDILIPLALGGALIVASIILIIRKFVRRSRSEQ